MGSQFLVSHLSSAYAYHYPKMYHCAKIDTCGALTADMVKFKLFYDKVQRSKLGPQRPNLVHSTILTKDAPVRL